MAATAPPASCISTDNGCVMFDCLVHLWEWIDPPIPQNQFQMENKKTAPATQQPLTQHHHLSHHVHPEQIYSQHPQLSAHLTSTQTNQIQPNGVMHQLLQSQYHSNMNARSPLLENRHELYGTGNNQDYARNYGANDNYNYPQTSPRETTEMQTDHNVNHELLQHMPKGYNAEVYQDYLKRNPPKDTNQIYQNHQYNMYRPTNNVNQYGSKPYLPYSNRIGSQSNTEQLRRQYNEIQQMKLQQQMHYQSQAQIHQQQKFAERQILLQQIHGVQPPPNLQNSIYSDGSYRDLDRYSSKDFKDFSSSDIQKEVDRYAKNNEFVELEKQNRQYQEWQPNSNQPTDFREPDRYRRQSEGDKGNSQSPPEFNNQTRINVGVVSPMKSSESSSPSVKSPSSDSRRSSSGTQALRSPVALRIPSAPVAMSGILYKQGSDGLKVWRKRWFVLSEYCLFYYKSQDEEKLLGSVLLPSYRVSACTAEDKVLRKYAFKLEHANMRTYILAAPEQEAMIKWVKVLTMAALMQSPNDQQKPSKRPAAKTEENDDIPGPTYANAPPKPRRSNEGVNSPSPDTYDPNYDLLKQPASHYSQGIGHTRHQDTTYPTSSTHEPTYTRSPPLPQHFQKRPYDTHNLSLPLTNTVTERLDQPSSSMYRNNPQSPYFDRNRPQENQDQIYERQPQRNPFIQETPTETTKENEMQVNRIMEDRPKSAFNEQYTEQNAKSNIDVTNNRDVYGELNSRPSRAGSAMNERLLIERRTPDAYGRSTTMSAYSKGNVGDYEDVYSAYAAENEYGKTYAKSPNVSQARDAISISSYQQQQESASANYPQEKTFSGPSVLRRKKMQANGIQPPMPRPHSADFLEYESKNEMLNKTMPARTTYEAPRQPQRPKSSLDIHSYYDPSSDRYYSEESYAAKMRQSAQYLQQGLAPRNIQIPLAKYASGLAEKQLQSPFPTANNNYETEFSLNKANSQNASLNSKYIEPEGLNSNWTLKEKEIQKEALNRSGSVMSDGMESNVSSFVKDMNRFDQTADGFTRSRSARLPSTTIEKEGDKKVQQREESMKRLLEWKQRMLQSPLTRKSTPATISLARSLNQSRQSLRSDQFKPKTYTNASYNSYSSDDEAETSGTELQKPREMQAGRSQRVNLTSPIIMQPTTPHAPFTPLSEDGDNTKSDEVSFSQHTENTYENILCTISIPKIPVDNISDDNDIDEKNSKNKSTEGINESDTCNNDSKSENGYETHESEAESEIQEYTDNDLDEVLLQSENEIPMCNKKTENNEVACKIEDKSQKIEGEQDRQPETPPVCLVEGHYLPMSPRKISKIEPATKLILDALSVFDQTRPPGFEDNPYVEMNSGNSEDDMQNYELVCVNNGRVEPVYMEVGNTTKAEHANKDSYKNSFQTENASNFADTKDQTLKRVAKSEKILKDKSDCSDADDESSREVALDAPFSRFSISDTFRPASYYLRNKKSVIDLQDSSDSEIFTPPLISNSSTSCDDLTDEALSKYVLEKLDKSDILQDNSILKMLTSEKQKMNTVKRKTTSLMIYGSRTSLSDTLSRGEKVRNSRASLTIDRIKFNESTSSLLANSIIERCNSSSIETDSLRSYNADRGSSRLSIDSDISSKFGMTPSNMSSEVPSLNESESTIELRNPRGYQDVDMMIKRRPLSDDSLFELAESAEAKVQCDSINHIDLDSYLDNLQPGTSELHNYATFNATGSEKYPVCSDNVAHAVQSQHPTHTRCSSTPVNTSKLNTLDYKMSIAAQYKKLDQQAANFIGSQTSCSSLGIAKSPISYYCKSYEEETLLSKNLNNDILADKIKEFENEKVSLRTDNDTNTSSTTTGFHSRESSTEHSAPYYYSDLSSQEHINLMPTSHFLKNTNLHRKLNNQRRRGPLHKKNEISHIYNPIHNNQVLMSEKKPFELAAARSVSVEFLHAAEKDPEIDLKNLYESTGGRNSKIPESMSLISGLGCKRNSNNNSNNENSSPESSVLQRTSLSATSSSIKVSNASMSSHCSGNSSNTVYYDAEAEASAYENVLCQGEKHWDEDALWRDNLRRVSHKHAKSMDDLDAMPSENFSSARISDVSGMNSIKRVKKCVSNKISRNVTYVNCDIQNQVLQRRENNSSFHSICAENEEKTDDNDVYVSLAEDAEPPLQHVDEGVYEQLAVESSHNSLVSTNPDTSNQERNRRRFEIDREKLRQWDLMSSGLMKGGVGRVRVAGAGLGTGDALSSMDTRTDTTSNEASMTMSGANLESGLNNSSSNPQALSNKSFLGSNTSIGRNNRDSNIPVRAVSPRVRWVEDKPANDQYRSQQISTSQQNLHTLNINDDLWSTLRSPSRASQQPIRAVSPRIRRNTENDDMRRNQGLGELSDVPSAGDLLGRTHEELVLLLIQLRRRRTATNRAIEACCAHIRSIEDSLGSLKAAEREESLQRLEQLKMQLMDLEHQYEKSKPLVQLVDNMVKLGSLYNRPGSTVERLERNQRLRQKVLAEHASEQQRWLESAAAGRPLETEAARARVAELWALEQELADEASILQGLKTDKETIESMLTGVRGKLVSVPRNDYNLGMTIGHTPNTETISPAVNNISGGLEAELARVHAMLAHNSKKLEQTVADNARLERSLQQLRRALQARRSTPHPPQHATEMLEDEVLRVQQLVSALQRQRQELSRAVRLLTQQSHALQTHDSMNGKHRPLPSWQETNLDTGHTIDHGHSDYKYEGHYGTNVQAPLYVDTRGGEVTSPLTSEEMQHGGFANLSNVEKQEIKTVRIVKRESERRQRDRDRSLQPMSDWPTNNLTTNLDQYIEEELVHSLNHTRASSVPRTDYSKFEEYYSKPEPPTYLRLHEKNMELSPKYPSSPSLSYDYSQNISSMSNSYSKSYEHSGYDRMISVSNQYLNSPTDSSRTLTNDPISKTSSVVSLTRSNMELSPMFKSEAAKQIITEMSGEPKNGSLHRRQVPKEKRRHNTAPHHLSAKTLNEMPQDVFNQDKLGRSLDDADMERALRGQPAPDVVRSAVPTLKFADSTIDQLLAAPQKILIPERYIPEKPPELSPEEQLKRQEKVESIKKMLSGSSADPSKSPEGEDKKQREHLLQMNQILAKQVTEMSKIIAVKALEELPLRKLSELDDASPDVELPIYQQRDNFFT